MAKYEIHLLLLNFPVTPFLTELLFLPLESNKMAYYETDYVIFLLLSQNHRYLKNIDRLSFVMCPLLAPHLPRAFSAFLAAATNTTN